MAKSPIKGDAYDTGWVSLLSYLTSGFKARSTNLASPFCPAYRIVNSIVYYKGQVYSDSSKGSKSAIILSGIPNEIRQLENFSSGSVRFGGTPYSIRVQDSGIYVHDTSTIGNQDDWAGYALGAINPYPVL